MLDIIFQLIYGALGVVGLVWWAALIIIMAVAPFGVLVTLIFGDPMPPLKSFSEEPTQ